MTFRLWRCFFNAKLSLLTHLLSFASLFLHTQPIAKTGEPLLELSMFYVFYTNNVCGGDILLVSTMSQRKILPMFV